MKRVVVVALIAAMVVCNTVGCSGHDESKNITDSVKTTDVEDEAKERDLSYLDNVELEGETDVSEIETESDVGTDNSDVEQSEDVTWDDILKVSSDGDSSTNISIDYIPSEVIDKIYDFITNSGTLTIYTESDTIFEFKYMKDMKARSELIDYGDGYTWWDGTRFLIHTPDESSYQDGDLQRWRINDFDYDKYDFVKQFIDFLNENRTNCEFSTKDYGFYICIENLGNKISFVIGCGFTVDNKLKTFGINAYDDTSDSTGDGGIFSCFVTDTSIPQYSDGLNTSETYLMYTYPESEIEHTLGVIDRILNCFNSDVVGSIDTTVVDASTDTAESEKVVYDEVYNNMRLIEKEEITDFTEQLDACKCPRNKTKNYHLCEFYDRGDGTGYTKRFEFIDRGFVIDEQFMKSYEFSDKNSYKASVYVFNTPYVPDFAYMLYDEFIGVGQDIYVWLIDRGNRCRYTNFGDGTYTIVNTDNKNALTVCDDGNKTQAWFYYKDGDCYRCEDFSLSSKRFDVFTIVHDMLINEVSFVDPSDTNNYECTGKNGFGYKDKSISKYQFYCHTKEGWLASGTLIDNDLELYYFDFYSNAGDANLMSRVTIPPDARSEIPKEYMSSRYITDKNSIDYKVVSDLKLSGYFWVLFK